MKIDLVFPTRFCLLGQLGHMLANSTLVFLLIHEACQEKAKKLFFCNYTNT